MRYRCTAPACDQWAAYGGRGIKVCTEWTEFPAFLAWSLANGWRAGRSIDRIDVDGDYEPSNCRWATPKQQAENKRPVLAVTVQGVRKSVLQWAKTSGIPQATLYKRYHAGIRGAAFLAEPNNPAKAKGATM